jgi:hypothetical protein
MSAIGAIPLLRKHGVVFNEHTYRYEERGGTAVSSRELGVSEHSVIKTLVMEDENRQPLIVLMHGDREVSTKNLARQIGRKTVAPARPRLRSDTVATKLVAHPLSERERRCRFLWNDRSRISSGFTSMADGAGYSSRWRPPS